MPARLGVQLYSVRDQLAADRPATLRRLAELGYRFVEPFALALWNTSAADRAATAHALRADLDAAGLAVSSHHVAIGLRDQAAVAEECRILGTDLAIVAISFLVEGFGLDVFTDRQALTAFAACLNGAARELADHGIRLGYHNHAFEWSVLPDGFCGFEVLWDLLDPGIVAEVDLYWAAVAGRNPGHVLASLGERAVAAHVKDGPVGEAAHLRNDPAGLAVPQTSLGTGQVDIPAALRAGTHLHWHIAEIDTSEADPFELLAENRRVLLDGGLSLP